VRLILVIVGGIVSLMGAVWAFQGAGYIPGSFMSNDPTWIYIGGGTVVVGLILAFLGIRSKPAAKTQP